MISCRSAASEKEVNLVRDGSLLFSSIAVNLGKLYAINSFTRE